MTLIKTLNKIGGENGIGLLDIVENRLVGMKSRGVYETPGGTILYKAHEVLETICLDKATQHYKYLVAQKFGELVYDGCGTLLCGKLSPLLWTRLRKLSPAM